MLDRPDERTVLSWCVAFAGCAFLASVLIAPHGDNPFTTGPALHRILNAGAFNLLAWPMIFSRIFVFGRRPAPLSLILLALLIGLFCVIPVGVVPAVALAGFGLVLLCRRAAPVAAREAGILALALGASIGSPYARFLHLAFARLDAQVVGILMALHGVPVSVSGNLITDAHFTIEVLAACASSAPLAGCLLAYVMITIHLRGMPGKADLPWLLLSLFTSVVLTELRLMLMVPSEAAWDFWHNGLGLTFYEIAALLFAGLYPVLAGLRGPHGTALAKEPV